MQTITEAILAVNKRFDDPETNAAVSKDLEELRLEPQLLLQVIGLSDVASIGNNRRLLQAMTMGVLFGIESMRDREKEKRDGT